MSLVFIPKIPESFESSNLVAIEEKEENTRKKGKAAKPWQAKEIEQLVELRAMGVPMIESGKLLKRSTAACGGVIFSNNLKIAIDARKKVLISEIMR